MIVNGKKYDIDALVKNLDTTRYSLQKVGAIWLTNEEIEILKRYSINYQKANSLRDLMIKIEDVIEDESIDNEELAELDYILETISERDYYENTKR